MKRLQWSLIFIASITCLSLATTSYGIANQRPIAQLLERSKKSKTQPQTAVQLLKKRIAKIDASAHPESEKLKDLLVAIGYSLLKVTAPHLVIIAQETASLITLIVSGYVVTKIVGRK